MTMTNAIITVQSHEQNSTNFVLFLQTRVTVHAPLAYIDITEGTAEVQLLIIACMTMVFFLSISE